MIEDFFHLPPVSTTPVCTLSCEYLHEFSKKFETALMVYSGAGGKLSHEKNQKSKISWHCPLSRQPSLVINIVGPTTLATVGSQFMPPPLD